MDGGVPTDLVVGEGTSILELSTGEEEALVFGRYRDAPLDVVLDPFDEGGPAGFHCQGLALQPPDPYLPKATPGVLGGSQARGARGQAGARFGGLGELGGSGCCVTGV